VQPSKFVQWGLSGSPQEDAAWDPLISDIRMENNNYGYVSFYQPNGTNSGSTEILVNLGTNADFDSLGFAPFALVNSADMKVVEKLYSGYGTKPDEETIKTQGNAYLDQNFPLLDKVLDTTVHVYCARGTQLCDYNSADPFAVQCCVDGETCIAGVGCRCLMGSACPPTRHNKRNN